MAIQLDDLVARLRLDTSDVSKGVGKVDSALSGTTTKSKSFGKSIAGSMLKVTAGLAIGAKAISFVGDSIAEGREANKITALTEQRIKTMGNVAGISAKQVGKLAESISAKTGIDDEQIQSSANLLLSFSQVQNRGKGLEAIFTRANKAAVDLSAGGFGSIDGASKQLGKALQDPVKGIAALSRSGVTFTEKQQAAIKAMVESNNILGAQKIILGEVEKQVKGSAEAQATAADKAKVGYQNLQEQIGVALIPTIDKLANFFSEKIVPAVSKFITQMQNGKGAGGDFADALQRIGDVIQTVGGFLIDHKKQLGLLAAAYVAFKVVQGVVAGATAVYSGVVKTISAATKVYAAMQWLLNAALTANPIGAVVVILGLLVAATIIAYRKSETFRNVVKAALEAVGGAWRSLWNNVIQPVLSFIVNGIADLMDMFGSLLDAISHVPGMGWVGDLADKMHHAADETHAVAEAIRDIPTEHTTTLNIVTIRSAQDKNERQTGGSSRGASAAGSGTAGLGLTGILEGLFDGLPAQMGPLQADAEADVSTLLDKIETEYVSQGEAAAKRIHTHFVKMRKALEKRIREAKTGGKKGAGADIDPQSADAALDALEQKEKNRTKAAIKRFKDKAKAARDAAAVINAGLIENGRLQDVVNAALEVAQANLERLTEQAAAYSANIAKSFADFANVVGLGIRQVGEQTIVTAASLLEDLRAKLARARAFAALIGSLVAQGLDQSVIDQLLSAGPEAGFATAQAIADGGPAAIAEVNSLTEQIGATGVALGEQLATTFYGAGIAGAQAVVDGLVLGPDGLIALQKRAADLRVQLDRILGSSVKQSGEDAGKSTVDGVIAGLEAKEGALDKAMRKIAKAMIQSLKDELDMHSPSRKLRAAGLLAGTSVAMGLDQSIPQVTAAMGRLASAATFDADSLAAAQFGTTAVGAARLAQGSLSAAPLNLKVYLGDKEISEIVRVEIGGVLQPLGTYAKQGAL